MREGLGSVGLLGNMQTSASVIITLGGPKQKGGSHTAAS